jgi:hypothetical protein
MDVHAVRRDIGDLLGRVSVAVRRGANGPDVDATTEDWVVDGPPESPTPLDFRGRDLVGRDLRNQSMRGADLRGALLIGVDLRGTDLRLADLLGADLRGAQLAGADLRDALFLTGPQLAAADGDAATRIPEVLERPAHWRVTG